MLKITKKKKKNIEDYKKKLKKKPIRKSRS